MQIHLWTADKRSAWVVTKQTAGRNSENGKQGAEHEIGSETVKQVTVSI